MARQARIVVPGVAHHVNQRGNRRPPVFFGDGILPRISSRHQQPDTTHPNSFANYRMASSFASDPLKSFPKFDGILDGRARADADNLDVILNGYLPSNVPVGVTIVRNGGISLFGTSWLDSLPYRPTFPAA